MEAELQNKHVERKKTKTGLRSISLGLILFNAIIKKTNVAVKSRIKTITYRHEKKLNNLRKLQQNYVYTKTKQHHVRQIIYTFTSYVLSRDEEIALSYGLDQHIPSNLNRLILKLNSNNFIKDFSKTYQISQKRIYQR